MGSSVWGLYALVFTGTFEHAIDAKHRLAIPAEVRNLLLREAPSGLPGVDGAIPLALYVTLGDGALCLYTEAEFEKRAKELDESELDADELLEFERMMFSSANRVELDAQGRVRIPDNLLKDSGLGTEVVLIGVKDHLEVRDRAAWKAYVQDVLTRKPGLLMNPRRAMRAKASGTGESVSR
ncbi:MAG: hypothetical protein HC898_05260 [Phycisphaerales bacterium]|nr:hypothetical protein [Phycisphaerales bacterium]